jgi:hypothetical protein
MVLLNLKGQKYMSLIDFLSTSLSWWSLIAIWAQVAMPKILPEHSSHLFCILFVVIALPYTFRSLGPLCRQSSLETLRKPPEKFRYTREPQFSRHRSSDPQVVLLGRSFDICIIWHGEWPS